MDLVGCIANCLKSSTSVRYVKVQWRSQGEAGTYGPKFYPGQVAIIKRDKHKMGTNKFGRYACSIGFKFNFCPSVRNLGYATDKDR